MTIVFLKPCKRFSIAFNLASRWRSSSTDATLVAPPVAWPQAIRRRLIISKCSFMTSRTHLMSATDANASASLSGVLSIAGETGIATRFYFDDIVVLKSS